MDVLERYGGYGPGNADSKSQQKLKDANSIIFEEYRKDSRPLSEAEVVDAKHASGVLLEPRGARSDYQDAVRARFFCAEGEKHGAIARRLDRPERWVLDACSGAAPAVPRSVPPYVADYGARCVAAGVQPFRPAELLRGLVQAPALGAIRSLSTLNWQPASAIKRDYNTGHINDTGHRLLRERASLGLLTGIPSIDRAIQEVVNLFQIDDPGAYLLCNRYKDGRAFIAPHQHDFWSATFSFGASRVFLLDQRPLLLANGDVLVFGSQRHSVPKMPQLKDERISLSLFWFPNWHEREYTDEQITRWRAQVMEENAWAGRRVAAVAALAELGASEFDAVEALIAANDDIDAAAAALLTKLSKETAHSDAGTQSKRDEARWSKTTQGLGCSDAIIRLTGGETNVSAATGQLVEQPNDKVVARGRWRKKE